MNRVFKRRSSGQSASSSISFLSDWFEHSSKASGDVAQDPSYQLANPSPSDLKATRLADSVNSIKPILQASKQVPSSLPKKYSFKQSLCYNLA